MILILLLCVLGLLVELRYRLHSMRFEQVQQQLKEMKDVSSAHQEPEPYAGTDMSTLKLLNVDGSEECEVAWHRHEIPDIMTYAGKTFHKHRQRENGTWEFNNAS